MILNFAGDFDIVSMEIISKDIVIDVRNLLVELNVYKDLFSDGITADIILSDSRNLPLYLPLVGDEILNLIFNTPIDGKKSAEISFQLPIISLKRESLKERQQLLVLNCISKSMLESSKTTISKSYNGKLHSEIIKDIFDTYLNPHNLEVDIEPSKYAENLVIPRYKPFEAIRFITQRAISTNGTADFFFYEGRDSYKFKSLNTLYQQEPVATLSNNPAGLGFAVDLLKIINFNHEISFDTKKNVERGMLGSTVLSWDPDNKELVKTEFSYFDFFGRQAHLGNQKLVFDETELANPLNRIFFESVTTDTRSNEWRPQRQSSLQVINNNRIIVIVPGNTGLDVGEIVNFNIPSTEQHSGSILPQNDTRLSGKWLITSIRHKIDINNHVIVLDLAKESFGDKLLIGDRGKIQEALSPQNFNEFF